MKFPNSSTNTIWRYSGFYKRKIGAKHQVFLEENLTPLEKIGSIFLKREDKSVIGSHKFRPLTYQFASLLEDNIKSATISSSGNAAITMAKLSSDYPIKSYIFVSPDTPISKKSQIDDSNSLIIESKKALRLSNYLSKKANIPQLRPSKDDNAIEGYKSLGFELYEQNPDIDAIFFFISSGASLLGVYEAYKKLKKLGKIEAVPALHAVLANEQPEGFLAGSCARTHLRRQNSVEEAINKSAGQKWRLDNEDLKNIKDLNSSYESFAAYAACQKALEKYEYRAPVVICSGKRWEESEAEIKETIKLETFEELDKFIEANNF